jgi:hypothetical protein
MSRIRNTAAYVAWRAGTTTRRQSQLHPPERDWLQVAISLTLTLIVEEALRCASSILSLLMEWIDHVDKLRAGVSLSPCPLH